MSIICGFTLFSENFAVVLKKLVQSFSICHWNLNSISLHDSTELLSLLRAQKKYAFTRADHPLNTKQW